LLYQEFTFKTYVVWSSIAKRAAIDTALIFAQNTIPHRMYRFKENFIPWKIPGK
jgi:hypothetical protein